MMKLAEDLQKQFLILTKPYIKVGDIQTVTDLSYSSINRILRKSNIKKYPGWGYVTDDIIQVFKLESYAQRLENLFRQSI